MKPSDKSGKMEEFIDGFNKARGNLSRKFAIKADKCVVCKRKLDIKKEFKDELSKQEYTISGMCQKCQDDSFVKQCEMCHKAMEEGEPQIPVDVEMKIQGAEGKLRYDICRECYDDGFCVECQTFSQRYKDRGYCPHCGFDKGKTPVIDVTEEFKKALQ